MRRSLSLILLSALIACSNGTDSKGIDDTDSPADTDLPEEEGDADDDGYTVEMGDCNDADALVHPGAADAPYDGVDADCAGGEEYDVDGDGAAGPPGVGPDCDDTDATVYPGADDPPYDGVDADCQGDPDDDVDGDGYPAVEAGGTDCDDLEAAIHPGATETWYDGVDADCSGGSDFDADEDGDDAAEHGGADCDDAAPHTHPGAFDAPYDGTDADCLGDSDYDFDGDGHDHASYGGDDCDDANPFVHPGAADLPYDGVDADCLGDDDDDLDGDGYAAVIAGGDDCADDDPGVHPGAAERWYDGVDSDCDGGSDYDRDGDGHAHSSGGGDDCDDGDAEVHPGALEVCNGKDDDCEGSADGPDAWDILTWYADSDEDGFGTGPEIFACDQPPLTAEVDEDCDDTDPFTWPGAPPIACDGQENDCDADPLEAGGGIINGTATYLDLPTAIAAAGPGDTVELCEGTYDVALSLVSKGLLIVGRYGADLTLLDAHRLDGIFEIRTTGAVTLRGLTLTRGAGIRTGSDHQGGAVWADADADLLVEDCEIRDSRAGHGSGLWIGDGGRLELRRVDVVDNDGDDSVAPVPFGGGLGVGEDATVILEDTTIARNEAGACAGVWLQEGASISGLGLSEIHHNTASLGGGGLCGNEGDNVVTDVNVRDNEAAVGGGLEVYDATLIGLRVEGNESTLGGGGIKGGGTLVLQQVQLVDNTAGIDGGAVDLAPGADLTLEECLITANDATFFAAQAGGVRVDGGTVTSVNTDWGSTPRDNPPADLALVQDATTHNYTGVMSFFCDDGSGLGCL